MTTSPDPATPPSPDAEAAPTTPDVDAAPTTPDADAAPTTPDAERAQRDEALDPGTFTRIIEPRGTARLPLDGRWHQLARAYVWVSVISTGLVLVLVLAAAIVVQLWFRQPLVWIPAGILLAVLAVTIVITPRQARSYGYQLRDDDLVFRRGILWQRIVAVPYGRMQLIDITHGPLDRGFGIAQLKLVTAAASSGVTIPGLPQEAAERLRDTLVEVAETRRTGL